MGNESNRFELTRAIEEKAGLCPVQKQLNPDGSFNIEWNRKLWNDFTARFESIQLWESGAPGFDGRDPSQRQPSIVFLRAPEIGSNRGTVLIAHGGGFRTQAVHEGYYVADFFNKAGFATATLTYRLSPYSRLDAMADMHRAVRTLRAHREELGITDKVAVMGFSAGGMLSCNCGTHFDRGNPASLDEIERFSCRPDAVIAGYGAFSAVSFPGQFGQDPFHDPDRAEQMYLAPEKNVTEETPPFFIWQTNGDDPRRSMNLAWELTDRGIPFELHCFPEGPHGIGLADGNNDAAIHIPHVAHWSTLCAEWLESLGF